MSNSTKSYIKVPYIGATSFIYTMTTSSSASSGMSKVSALTSLYSVSTSFHTRKKVLGIDYVTEPNSAETITDYASFASTEWRTDCVQVITSTGRSPYTYSMTSTACKASLTLSGSADQPTYTTLKNYANTSISNYQRFALARYDTETNTSMLSLLQSRKYYSTWFADKTTTKGYTYNTITYQVASSTYYENYTTTRTTSEVVVPFFKNLISGSIHTKNFYPQSYNTYHSSFTNLNSYSELSTFSSSSSSQFNESFSVSQTITQYVSQYFTDSNTSVRRLDIGSAYYLVSQTNLNAGTWSASLYTINRFTLPNTPVNIISSYFKTEESTCPWTHYHTKYSSLSSCFNTITVYSTSTYGYKGITTSSSSMSSPSPIKCKQIAVGLSDNSVKEVKKIYIGDSSDTAQKVWNTDDYVTSQVGKKVMIVGFSDNSIKQIYSTDGGQTFSDLSNETIRFKPSTSYAISGCWMWWNDGYFYLLTYFDGSSYMRFRQLIKLKDDLTEPQTVLLTSSTQYSMTTSYAKTAYFPEDNLFILLCKNSSNLYKVINVYEALNGNWTISFDDLPFYSWSIPAGTKISDDIIKTIYLSDILVRDGQLIATFCASQYTYSFLPYRNYLLREYDSVMSIPHKVQGLYFDVRNSPGIYTEPYRYWEHISHQTEYGYWSVEGSSSNSYPYGAMDMKLGNNLSSVINSNNSIDKLTLDMDNILIACRSYQNYYYGDIADAGSGTVGIENIYYMQYNNRVVNNVTVLPEDIMMSSESKPSYLFRLGDKTYIGSIYLNTYEYDNGQLKLVPFQLTKECYQTKDRFVTTNGFLMGVGVNRSSYAGFICKIAEGTETIVYDASMRTLLGGTLGFEIVCNAPYGFYRYGHDN